MARRANPRAIKGARSYTVELAAEALGVSEATIRNWIRRGLPIMNSKRPALILGEAIREFLTARKVSTKVQLEPNEAYCFSCQAAREPFGKLVDYVPQTAKTGRLFGLCSECSGYCNRIISNARLPDFKAVLDITFQEGLPP